jgi:hypothetical protein
MPIARGDVVRLSRPSLCLNSHEVQTVCKLAEVSKRFLRVVAERFVSHRRDFPIAEVLIQDCTPLRTATIHVGGSGSAHVTRRGRQCREWLVQRLFLVDHAGDKAIVFVDPRDMLCKTAAAHHQAGVELAARC